MRADVAPLVHYPPGPCVKFCTQWAVALYEIGPAVLFGHSLGPVFVAYYQHPKGGAVFQLAGYSGQALSADLCQVFPTVNRKKNANRGLHFFGFFLATLLGTR